MFLHLNDTESEQVLSIMPHTTIEVAQDCDTVLDELPRAGATATITRRQIQIAPNKTTLDDLKLELVKNYTLYRRQKAEEELRHLKECNKIKYDMMQEEFRALKEKNALDIEEEKIKIAILKKQSEE